MFGLTISPFTSRNDFGALLTVGGVGMSQSEPVERIPCWHKLNKEGRRLDGI